jgi:hypothetical protein
MADSGFYKKRGFTNRIEEKPLVEITPEQKNFELHEYAEKFMKIILDHCIQITINISRSQLPSYLKGVHTDLTAKIERIDTLIESGAKLDIKNKSLDQYLSGLIYNYLISPPARSKDPTGIMYKAMITLKKKFAQQTLGLPMMNTQHMGNYNIDPNIKKNNSNLFNFVLQQINDPDIKKMLMEFKEKLNSNIRQLTDEEYKAIKEKRDAKYAELIGILDAKPVNRVGKNDNLDTNPISNRSTVSDTSYTDDPEMTHALPPSPNKVRIEEWPMPKKPLLHRLFPLFSKKTNPKPNIPPAEPNTKFYEEGGARKFTRKSRDVSRPYRRTSRVLRGARSSSRKAHRGAARRTRRRSTA